MAAGGWELTTENAEVAEDEENQDLMKSENFEMRFNEEKMSGNRPRQKSGSLRSSSGMNGRNP